MPRHQNRKKALVEKLVKSAGRGKDGAEANFVRLYFDQAAPDDILETDPDELLGGALSVWKLMLVHKPGKPTIRAFNPRTGPDGWNSAHTIIEIINNDMPFLVDSVTEELNQNNLTVHLVIHPVLQVRRNGSHRVANITGGTTPMAGTTAESVMHIEVNEQTPPENLRRIERRLGKVLEDVCAAVNHWQPMRARIDDTIAELEANPPPLAADDIEEARAFLRWLGDHHFTFLGYREYDFTGSGRAARLSAVPRSGLGLLRKKDVFLFEGLTDHIKLPPEVANFLQKPTLVSVSKANRRSTVHRAVHLDTIGIKRFDKSGRVVGERLFTGLFTSDVYSAAVRDIPLLRRKVEQILKRAQFPVVSHHGKALLHTLETLPRDELLQVREEDLLVTAMGILHLQERQRIALFVHQDPFGRFISCLVYVPKERYDTQLRRVLQRVVEDGFGGKVTAYYTQISDAPLARLHLIVKVTPGVAAPCSVEEVERRLVEAGRDWREDFCQCLVAHHGEARGLELFRLHGNAFPVAYRESFDAAETVSDVAHVEAALASDMVGMDLYRPPGVEKHRVRFKLYHRDAPVPLSDVLPMLENMGFKVIDEVPHRIEPRDHDHEVWIHDFGLLGSSGAAIDLVRVKPLFEAAFTRIWSGEVENDGFNKLVPGAGLAWRQVVVLRAYCKYMRQAAIPFSQDYMEETLASNPNIARMIVELFESLFDPDGQEGAQARCNRLRRRIERALDGVAVLDEDRILRRYLNVVESTLRTNYYQLGADGASKSYVSFKLNSQAIDELPLPRPLVEIFVHSPRVDAIHLRGGKVARGGIRWSDRREDFRTEILGLMKSQMTKNAVIVPVGSKGGFVVKRPPAAGGREAFINEGIACYQTMMRGMLDITDNLDKGDIKAPDRVVRRDQDDPYLVVAADKGTATFSDIANGIARDYGFWLDDAFASGGSVGYDHKVMGITARGAWESVKRHFRELDIDTQSQEFTCVGVGDMSGDVFGNGMLLSRHIKLVGGFNHLHIFVDPDPDPKAGFRERRRLFKLKRSSWADYDTKLISKGGGVFPRTAKSIEVTPEMRRALDLSGKEKLTPNELISAMIGAPVDLLWFGGIGTYVKARSETHVEAGDRSNDAVRLNGHEIRARVIGEGANLGVTQLGRIEYALAGGRINTDFIDNSAGVDCSDHEVNIKILLGDAINANKLTLERRDKLLAEMTKEVAALVLMDNYRQSMALSNAEHQSAALLDEHTRFMHALERDGKLDRGVEFLPDDETLDQRRADREGLVRPEMSVLLAYAKTTFDEDLVTGDVLDDPYLTRDVDRYFPTPLRKNFADIIPRHRLRREITSTYVTNSLVNRTGPSFVNEMQERTGAPTNNIARAYLVCREVYRLAELWSGVEALDNSVPAEVQTLMHLAILQLIKRGTLWFLRNGARPLAIDPAVTAFEPGVCALRDNLDRLLSPGLKQTVDAQAADFETHNVPADLAARVASLDVLAPACDIVRIARREKHDPCSVAEIYYGLGAKFGFDWLRAAAESLSDGNEWQKMAVAAIVDDLYAHQTELTTKALDAAGDIILASVVIEVWSATHEHAVLRLANLVADLRTAPNIDLAMLAVANREIRSLVAT